MSKSLQKCILFAVCIALVCALGVTLFIFDGTGGAVTGQEGQASGVADAAANSYEHGSNIGRQVSSDARPVTDESTFLEALAKNQDIDLQADLKLETPNQDEDWRIDLANSQAFRASTANGTYTGTLFGNGHTISYKGIQETTNRVASYLYDGRTFEDWDFGGIVNSLSGKIYDLNVVMTGGSAAFMAEGHNSLHVGGIVGYMYGSATIDNCTFTKEGDGRLASGMESSPGWGTGTKYAAVGGIVGRIATSGTPTITNCTVNWNGGTLAAGIYSGSAIGSGSYGMAGLVVGVCYDVDATINKIIVNGSGTINAAYAANIGCTGSGAVTITVPYYLNNFKGQYSNGGSASAAWHSQSGSGSVTNRILGPNTNDTSSNPKIQSDSGFNVYFDPYYSSDNTNFLAIEFTGVTYSPSQYEYSLTSGDDSIQSGKFSASASNNVLVRNLPATPSTWNRDGNFTATLNSELLFNPDDYENPLDRYEHGYTEGQTTSTGMAISTGDEWENIFAPSASGTPSGTYYLTDDIVINGFTGKSMSGVTIDGNGKTIFVIGTTQSSYSGSYVGGLVGDFTGGTIKNVRVVYLSLAGEISFTMSTERGGRVGLLAGRITNSRIENVQVCVDEGVTVNAAASNDTQFAMGGLIGEAATGSSITGATVDLNGELNPSGKWQFLGGIVGVVQSANTSGTSATVNMENIIIRGAGTLSGNALNNNQPTFTAAVAVLMPTTGAVPAVPFVTIDGLIYDFAVTLNGQLNGTGGTGNQYACYYLFTYNYNDYRSDGWQTGKPISEYNKAVSYSNVFVNSAYKDKLAEYAGQRTNGNAAIGGAVINTIQNKVEGLENPVAAYFNPVDGADDMIFRASGSWDSDRMVILTLSDGTVRESKLETAGVNTSAKLVYAPKTLAATDNVVQLSLYENVNWPTAPAALTYNGAEQSFAFTLHTVSGTPVESGDYTVAYSVKEGNTGALGGNNLPLNAGTYTATIELTNGMEFIDDGQGTTSPEYSLTVTVAPFEVEGNWTYNGGLTITYGDPDPSNIDQYISVALTSTGIPGGLKSVTASGFTTDYTQGAAAGTTVNITAGTYTVDSGSADNYDFTGITGSGTVEVQKKELTITNLGDDASHITDSYGSNVTSLEDLATLFETEGMSYVQGIYENQAVTFTITAFTYDRYYDDGADGALEEGADATSLISDRLYAKTYYTATVTLASDNAVNDNYELAEGSTFVYYIEPLVIEITGAEFAGGGTSVLYDGNAHEIQVVYTGALDGDNLTFTTNVFYNSESFEGTALTNAGEYTIDVSFDPQNAFHGEANYNYDIGVDGSENTPYTLTISPITLTISDKSGVYTDFVAADIVIDDMVSGILEGDTEGVTITPAWDTPLADEDGWLAANTYNATLSLGGDKAVNYTFGSDNVATVTVSRFDLSGAQVTITSASFTYNGNEQTVLYTVLTGEGGKDITSVLTPAGNTQTNAGENYTLTLTGDDNFTGSATANWSIAKKDITFAWSVSGEIVEGMAADEVKALATVTNNGGILEADTYTFSVDIGDYSESTLQGTAVTFTPSVTFTEEGDAANYNITFSPETEELIVQLGKVEIGVTQATVNTDYVNGYTSAAQFLANFTTSVPDVTIDGENFTVTVTRKDVGAVGFGSLLDVGEYTVTLTSSVYNLTGTTTYSYQVTATVAEISWDEASNFTYNGLAHTRTATVKNKVESDEVNVTVSLTEDTDNVNVTAEGFTFTATGLTGAAAGNYTIEGAANLISDVKTITPATLNIKQTAEETLTRPYDGTTTEATSFLTEKYVTITGGVSGENIYDMLNAEIADGGEIKNAGAYTITVTFNSVAEGAGNYSVGDFTSLEIVYEVTAKTITITFDGYEDLTYNGQARTLTATADFVSGENIDLDSLIAYTGNVTDGKAVNAGSYTATVTKAQIEGQNPNYTLAAESATQEFTISRATLTLTQADGAQLSRVYDGNAIEAGAFVSETYFTVSGYVDGGDKYALFTAAVDGGAVILNADSYTINITLNSGAEGAGNYTCEPFAISYEVTPIQWTASVTAPEGGLTYDGENKLGSLVPTPGDNEGTDIEGAPVIVATVTGGSMVNAGTYAVSLQLQTAEGAVYEGGNFELTAESAEIVIAKRVVEIIWAEASDFTYNGLAHTLTATVNNKVGEDEVNATVQLSGDNVKVTEKGFTYTVTGLTGEEAANYTIDGAENLTSKTQHIVRATLTVQFEGITGLEYTGAAHTVTANATGWQNSEDYNSTLNGLITIDGADTQVLNAGDYTATITKEALETALDNYTLAQDATVEFTVAPATLNVSVAIAGDGVVDNTLTWKVDGAVTVSDTADGWTLACGDVSYNITVTGGEDVENLLDMLQLTLNEAEYNGTPYGTRVQNGKLGVASTDPNYTVELVTTVNINIVPDISIEIRTGAEYPTSAVYSKDKTYTAADDFAGYFYIDGQPEGTWDYSVEGVESGSFSNVGTYTVKATFTIASGIKLENHFTFNITQATVTGVVLNGEGAYTYGDLTADSTVSVTVTYSDGNTATVNAGFEAAASKGGYVKAGESVELTLKGDDGKNTNYAKVDGQTVTVSVSKAEITADIYYEDTASVDGVLTLPYNGKEGYVVSVKLTGVRDGDVIYGALPTQIIDAGTYNSFEIALNGDDSGSYVITNAAAFSVRVTPKEITVEWSNSEGFTYDGTAKVPTATAKGTFDSDEVTLTVTVTGDNATEEGQAINAGDYTATVKAFVNGNYKLSEDSEQPFSIAKATATLGIENYQGSVEYNGSAVTVTPTVNDAAASEGIVNVTIAYTAADGSEAVSVNEIRNAGSYTVTLQISGALNYEDASQEFVITVTRAQLTINTANTSFTYGDNIDLGATVVNAIGGDDVSVVIDSVVSGGESAELKNAGTYTVTYRLEGAAAGNYKIIAGGSVEVTVDAKALTFTWNRDQTFTYNREAQVPGYTLNGVVDGDEVTITVTVTGDNETEGQAINAGVYTASVAEITKGNYSLTGVQPFSFTIGKAKLTVTPDSVKFSDRDADMLSAYSQTNYEATIKAGVTVTGVDSDDEFNDFTVTTGASFTGENGTLTVGDHTFTISVAGGNYNDATYTVSVTEQTVAEFTATPSSTTYTGGEITFTFASDSGIQLEEGVQITVSDITFNNASADSVLNAGSYTVTFAVTGNSADNNYWYTVRSWRGDISPATVEAKAVTAVYGDVYTALETGDSLQNGGVWQFVTFNGSPVEVTVTVTDATARAGETYLGAGEHTVTVTLVSGNYTFAGGNSVASTLQITPKQLNIAAQLPEDLTYTSEGIVIGLEDYASQLVGDDEVTVSMLVDGEPYVAGVTVLGAGEHTVTVTMTDTSGNYQLAAAQQTFTVEKKEVTSSITVSGETIENNSSLEIVHGENARVQNAIDNYLTQNGVEEGEYTLTVTNSAGQAADLDNISAWAPGTYTVNLGLSDNFEGGMTFTIVVQEGTTAQIPDAPVLPSTPLEDGGSSGAANWLFPLIIAIECLIAIALIVAIVISAIKRGKNA